VPFPAITEAVRDGVHAGQSLLRRTCPFLGGLIRVLGQATRSDFMPKTIDRRLDEDAHAFV
jgi:hypothetical protein